MGNSPPLPRVYSKPTFFRKPKFKTPMHKKLFYSASLTIALLLVNGCQTNSERAIKMQGQSGKMDRYSDYGNYAICRDPSHSPAWKGPLWREKERAMQDALDHNKANPGHEAKVENSNQ